MYGHMINISLSTYFTLKKNMGMGQALDTLSDWLLAKQLTAAILPYFDMNYYVFSMQQCAPYPVYKMLFNYWYDLSSRDSTDKFYTKKIQCFFL